MSRPLSGIDEIRALTVAAANTRMAARVSGAVTRSTPYELYIQNDGSALFIGANTKRKVYRRGDYIEVSGTTAPGHFLPILIEESSTLIGHRSLPNPVSADFASLASGKLDCLYVEVVGMVRAVDSSATGELKCRLAMIGGDLRVDIGPSEELQSTRLVGARVRVRGVAAGVKNHHRQIVQPVLLVQDTAECLQILTEPIGDVFAAQSQPISSVMSATELFKTTSIAKISGQVVAVTSPRHAYVRDSSDTIEINLQAPVDWRVGDLVEAAGFPENGLIKPHLVDAFARVLNHGSAPLPSVTTAEQLLSGNYDATLVEIGATLRQAYDSGNVITFSLHDGDVFFTAVCPKVAGSTPTTLPVAGTRLAVVGICSVDRMESTDTLLTTPKSFYLKMRGLEDVRVIQAPGFWTTRRLVGALAGLSGILVAAGSWIWSLRNTVRRQTRLILSQTRIQATNEERGRIARELHDSLEQQLAGTTILLDATAAAFQEKSESAKTHLDTARAMLRYSLDEAQRVVLNLRSRDLAHARFSDAMESSLRQIVGRSQIQLTTEIVGSECALDMVTENHVLRIAQEAVTNAVKHSGASRIHVVLEMNEQNLGLVVRDDGRGFVARPNQMNGRVGKFGLIGMQERSEKLRGSLSVESHVGQGTCITLSIPIERSRGE
ncbi:MAG TPA: sensor histidine kinase [Opitutaceae bacterium]|nr:sensor histidine kinase [Opitutaceae bacterium]